MMQAPVVVPADQTQQEQRSWDYTYVALGFFVGLLFSPILAGVALCCASFEDRVFRASFSRGVGFGYLTWGIILIAGGSIWNTAKCRPACNITYVYTSYGVKYTSYYTDTVCSSYCTVVMAALVACGVIFVIVGGILVSNSKKILQTDRQIAPQTVVVVQGYPQYAQQGYPQQEYQQYQTQPAYPQQYAQYPQQQQVAYAPQDQYAQPAYPQQQQVYYSNPPSPLPPKA